MKKLLSIVGALTITASSVTVVAFEYANLVKSSIEAKIRNYINVSSLLARGTILSQKVVVDEDNKPTDGQGFSLQYASKYLYSKDITDFFSTADFPNMADQSVRSFLGSMFNLSSAVGDVYTVKNNNDFQTNLTLQPGINDGKKGEEPIMNTLSLISAALAVLFGNDFSAGSSANFIQSVLSAGESAILGLFGEDGGTVKSMQDFLFDKDHNLSIFEKLDNALTEDDLVDFATTNNKAITDLHFQEVFNFRQIEFWQGLAEILYSGNHASDDKTTWDQWMDSIKNATDQKYAEVAVPTNVEINVVANKILIDGIAKVLRYVRTLFVYIQSFSEPASNLPIDQIVDDNHLFKSDDDDNPDNNLSNGMFLARKLNNETYINSQYVLDWDIPTNPNPDPEIIQWYKVGNTYHQVLNFQDIFSFFANLLSPDPLNDPHGYRVERNLAILFGLPLETDDRKSDAKNPVFDLVLEPLLTQLLTKMLNISQMKLIISIAAPLLRATLTYNNPLWKDVTGSSFLAPNVLSSLGLVKIALGEVIKDEKLKEALTKFLTDLEDEIKEERDPVVPVEQPVYGQPFTSIFNGKFLTEIFRLLNETNEPMLNISQAIQNNCKNLVTILTTNLGDLLNSFGLDISTLPIILYAIKNESLSSIIDTFAAEFETNREKTLQQNQTFLFNLGALNKVTKALGEKVEVTFTTGEVPKPVAVAGIIDDTHQTNILNAILIAFAYPKELASLKIIDAVDGDWNSSQIDILKPYTFLLGNRPGDNNNYSFATGSIFGTLAELYGHYNEGQTKDSPTIQKTTEDAFKRVITGAGEIVDWINKVSIPTYIADTFEPYFASKNWSTKLMETTNLNDSSQLGTLKYLLDYQNPETSKKYHYEVLLNRPARDGSEDNWNSLGTWKILSINKIS